MATWTRVIDAAAITPGTGREVTVGDRVLAVFQHDGAYHVIDGCCPHQGGPLAQARPDRRGVIRCPWHAWAFRVQDGCAPDGDAPRVTAYPLRVVDGSIEIRLDGATVDGAAVGAAADAGDTVGGATDAGDPAGGDTAEGSGSGDRPSPGALLAIDDVFFSASLRDALARLGYRCASARDLPALEAALAGGADPAARGTPPAVVIVDLNLKGADAIELIRRSRRTPVAPAVLAFAGHLAADRMTAARKAGAARVVTNGQVARQLPELLAGLGLPSIASAGSETGHLAGPR
ncbi:MAG: Rieske 2Fe-2S domain-containing protein [Candidatus Eiseniibacteriota bacterium]|jgi:nitrite reductase/ring-hydroxylating ferredoxin subunit/CheY-like chemotaxis protein